MLTSWDVTFCHAALGRTISSRLLRKCVFRCCWTFKGATSPIVGLRWTCTMMTSYNAEQVRNVLRLFGDRRSGCVGNTISIYTNDPISISITGVEVHVHSTHSPCKKPVQIEILVPACPSPNQRIILVSVWPNRQNGESVVDWTCCEIVEQLLSIRISRTVKAKLHCVIRTSWFEAYSCLHMSSSYVQEARRFTWTDGV